MFLKKNPQPTVLHQCPPSSPVPLPPFPGFKHISPSPPKKGVFQRHVVPFVDTSPGFSRAFSHTRRDPRFFPSLESHPPPPSTRVFGGRKTIQGWRSQNSPSGVRSRRVEEKKQFTRRPGSTSRPSPPRRWPCGSGRRRPAPCPWITVLAAARGRPRRWPAPARPARPRRRRPGSSA